MSCSWLLKAGKQREQRPLSDVFYLTLVIQQIHILEENQQFFASFTVHLCPALSFSCGSAAVSVQQVFPISFQSSFHIWRQRALKPFSVLLHPLLFQWEGRKWWTSNLKDGQNLTGWQILKYYVLFPVMRFHSFTEMDVYSTVSLLKHKTSMHIWWDTQRSAARHIMSVQER